MSPKRPNVAGRKPKLLLTYVRPILLPRATVTKMVCSNHGQIAYSRYASESIVVSYRM